MKSTIYNSLVEKKKQGKKSFAVLIDPDKVFKFGNRCWMNSLNFPSWPKLIIYW